MNLFRNDVYNLFVNTHVQFKVYREFYQGIIYIVNEGRHVRINIQFTQYNLLLFVTVTPGGTPGVSDWVLPIVYYDFR